MWFQVAHVLEESNLLQERHEITAFKLNYQLDVEWSMGLGHGNTYSPVGLYSSILYIKKTVKMQQICQLHGSKQTAYGNDF